MADAHATKLQMTTPLIARCCFSAAVLASCSACVLPIPSFAQTAQSTTKPQTTQNSPSKEFQELSARALADLDADKLDTAIPLLRKALALNPHWVEGWWSLGTAFYDQDRYAEAALAFQKVVAIDPNHGTALALLGLSEFELGEDAAALRHIEAAEEIGTNIDPQLRDVVVYHEGVLLQRDGRFFHAQQAFSSLCLSGAVTGNLIRAFGMAALQMRDKNFPAEGTQSDQVVQLVGHAACLAAKKDFASASAEFQRAVSLFPNFPYVHYAFGRELIEEQNVSGAVEQFKSEIAVGHDRVLPMLQIAAAEYKVDSLAGLPYAKQAVQLAPKMPFAHFVLGLLLMNTGDFAGAVPELEVASKGLPNEPNVFWSLGSAYEHVGRTQDAMKARAEFARLKQWAANQPHAVEGQPSEEFPLANVSETPPAERQ